MRKSTVKDMTPNPWGCTESDSTLLADSLFYSSSPNPNANCAQGIYFDDNDPEIISSSAPTAAGSIANATDKLLSRWQ